MRILVLSLILGAILNLINAQIDEQGVEIRAILASLASPPTTEAPSLPATLNELCRVSSANQPNPELYQQLGSVKKVNISTGEIAYLRFGNTAALRDPLIFIQGFGQTLRDLPLSLALQLASDQEIIAFDNRGEGLSTDTTSPDSPLTIQGMANDTLELIQALNITGKPTIFGISMGGMIATSLAANNGSDLGVVVVAVGSAGGIGSVPPDYVTVNTLTGVGNATEVQVTELLFDLNTEEGRIAACRFRAENALNPVNATQNTTTFQRQISAITDWFLASGVSDLLPSIKNPMLVIGGTKDPIVPLDNQKYIASKVPKSWFAEFPAKHLTVIQYQDAIVELFNTFYGVYGEKF